MLLVSRHLLVVRVVRIGVADPAVFAVSLHSLRAPLTALYTRVSAGISANVTSCWKNHSQFGSSPIPLALAVQNVWPQVPREFLHSSVARRRCSHRPSACGAHARWMVGQRSADLARPSVEGCIPAHTSARAHGKTPANCAASLAPQGA